MLKPSRPLRSAVVAFALNLLALPAFAAQDQAIVEIRYADVDQLDEVLRVFGVAAQAHRDLGLITLQGPPEAVAAAKAAAVSLDRPPEPSKNVEVTAYVLEASKEHPLEGGVPGALDEVAAQLRDVFGFQGVELVDTLVLTVLDGTAGQLSGSFPATDDRYATPYRFGFNRADVIPGDRPAVRLRGLLYESQATAPEKAGDAEELIGISPTRLTTDIEVRSGQKAVVGKAASVNRRAGTTILVIAVKVVE